MQANGLPLRTKRKSISLQAPMNVGKNGNGKKCPPLHGKNIRKLSSETDTTDSPLTLAAQVSDSLENTGRRRSSIAPLEYLFIICFLGFLEFESFRILFESFKLKLYFQTHQGYKISGVWNGADAFLYRKRQ